jgi:glycosyltransferase involved in cell wall biosynthesis
MRIVFINTCDVIGGAAIAAFRLNKGLERYFGTENYTIVGQKNSTDPAVFGTRSHRSQAMAMFKTTAEYMVDKSLNKLGLQYRWLPFSSRFILKKVKALNPDIISLHNTHGGYFKTSLLKKLSQMAPIAWTLHDMWSFTANASHTFGDTSWKRMKSGKGEKDIYPRIGIDTGRFLLKQKRRIYEKSDIHLIVPSNWLYGLAKESPVFRDKKISHIFHGIDLAKFHHKDKISCRRTLGLEEDARILIFSSASDLSLSQWKGGPVLIEILTAINAMTDQPIDILLLGKGELMTQGEWDNLRIHKVGYIPNEDLISAYLSASDLFINATRAETLSLAMIESIACGTPCVTFDVGGCDEVVRNDTSGFLIKPFDSKDFAAKTLDLLENTANLENLSRASRIWAEKHFSLTDMVTNYHDLFRSLLSDR